MRKTRFIKKIQALILAGSIAASVPVMTMAASTNRVTTTVSVAKNTELTGEDAPYLIIELKDDLKVGDEIYLELKNAEWIYDDITIEASNVSGEATFKKTLVDKDVLAVKLEKYLSDEDSDGDGENDELTTLPADALIRVRLSSKVKKASASVVIDADGTVISSEKSGIEYAKVSTAGATAKVSEVKNMTEGGTLGDITIEESFEGAFASELDRSGDLVITLKLDNSDVEFDSVKNVRVVGTKGFAGVTGRASIEDDDEIKIVVDGDSIIDKEKGSFKITGLSIETVDDDPISGTVDIDIESTSFKSMSVQVAKFVKESVDVKITPYSSDNKKGLIAGRTGMYKIDLTESSEEVIDDGKRLDFELEEGYFFEAETTNSKKALTLFESEISLPSEMVMTSVTLDDTQVVGFTVEVEADEDEVDEYTLKVPVAVDLKSVEKYIFNETEAKETTSSTRDSSSDSSADDGSTSVTFGGGDSEDTSTDEVKTTKTTTKKDIPAVQLTVSGKAISGEDIKTKVAEVIQPITVDIEEKVYKLGYKDQEGTDIVISETDAGMIDKGVLFVSFDDVRGMSFTEPPTVEVTKGDLKVGKGELVRSGNDLKGFAFNISKASKTKSEITISDVKVTSDRTVPEGKVGILIGGSAITSGDPVASKTYAKIADINVSDSAQTTNDAFQAQLDELKTTLANQTKEAPLTAIFTINSTTYSVNGTSKQMDGTPYISQDGRTMIPVRYVADAVGISADKILSKDGIITILGERDTIQFKIGSNVMLRNGAQIPMDTKAVLKDGRTYIPVSYAATALGVTSKYDQATKSVTFKNSAAASAAVVSTEQSVQPSTTQADTTQENTSNQSQQGTTTPTNNVPTDATDLFDILEKLN